MSKTLLVTSALPYANGDIHLGHMVEHIQTDIFVRYHRLKGNQCYYMCADDTHGTAIMLSAQKAGITPETFIEDVQKQHEADFSLYGISYDQYYTTHSQENETIAVEIYHAAKQDGGIIEKNIDQYFCEESQLFLADRYIKGECPACSAPDQYGDACEKCYATYSATELNNPISVFSGKPPVLKSSVHYFFKLNKYESVIQEWLSTNPVVDAVKNKLKEWFDQGLKDWDISRDAPYFGFQIPETDQKYFYVWMDAPVGYIATTAHWALKNGHSADDFWKNKSVEIHHFIGKDIMYFHTLFWPAMLSVAGYCAPKKVHIHGFLTINGEKMSKSRGTFILARDFVAHLHADTLRYYYASKLTASLEDIDFNGVDFLNKINSDVLGKYLNIASRIGAILNKNCNGQMGVMDQEGLNLIADILTKKQAISDCYESLDTNRAMRLIMGCADLANKYIDSKAPWQQVKDDVVRAQITCTTALNALRVLSVYLMPVMPKITEEVFLFLKIDPPNWESVNTPLQSHVIATYQHILKRLTLADIEQVFPQPK